MDAPILTGTMCSVTTPGERWPTCNGRAQHRLNGKPVCSDHRHKALCGGTETRVDGAVRVCVTCGESRGWA